MDVSIMQEVSTRLQEDRHLEDPSDLNFEFEALLLQQERRRQGTQHRRVSRAGPRLEQSRRERAAAGRGLRPYRLHRPPRQWARRGALHGDLRAGPLVVEIRR